jgi:two-component system, NarL family, nitrate/nitrite response regulator NarL
MGPTRVLVVDDYEPFRELIRSLLGKNSSVSIIGEASDGVEAVHQAAVLQPDLVLLDVGLPRLNGIRAAEQMRESAPNSKILFLAQDNCRDVIEAALNLGAIGYLQKSRIHGNLIFAIDTVLEGKQFILTDPELI